MPSSLRGLLLVVALGSGWGCSSADSRGLFGPALATEPGANESVGESVSGAAGAPNGGGAIPEPGIITGSGSEVVPPIVGGLQPTDAAPVSGAPVSSAPDAGVPEPDAPTEPPPVPSEPEPDEPTADAGVAPPVPPEPEPVCGGALLQGVCWYMGEVGQSCDDVCGTHGGVSAGALALIGTPAQGGSLEECTAVLQALGALSGAVSEGYRDDGLGLGCHLYVEAAGTEVAWWLTAPELSPQAFSAQSRQACGCSS